MIELLIIAALAAPVETLEPLSVTGRDIAADAPQSTAVLDQDAIEAIRPTHPAELFLRLPGSWVTRGSGQEHLSAVRSPILAGAGGCGALLILEAGVPVRPPGFCNVNGLFELNLNQAGSIRVLRGPGGIGHASGGLHGVIDITPRSPLNDPGTELKLEAGSNDYFRLAARQTGRIGRAVMSADFTAVDSGSFRADERYDHQLLGLQHVLPVAGGQWHTLLSAARLDQDTAGYILGYRAFADPELRRANLNPEAFRQAEALRLLSRREWLAESGAEHRLSLFARHSDMEFLQHYLPGQPLEENSQMSAGVQYDRSATGSGWDFGMDAELLRGELLQRQADPTAGPPATAAIRPPGRHYDYRVDGQRLGGYLARRFSLGSGWDLRIGAHAEWVDYRYDNRMSDGNQAEDGSHCDLGGCLYNRPADRSDHFFEVAPELSLERRFSHAQAWLRLARGFRAPQATELYRLQRGQSVAELDSERLDAVEIGIRGHSPFTWELVAYEQRKRHYIFRDAEGFNVSDGRSGHRGIEFSIRQELAPGLSLTGRGSYAVHRYRFDRDLGGEQIVSGQEIPAAPRRLASAELHWQPSAGTHIELAVEHVGSYWLNAANTHRYTGHSLVHVGFEQHFGKVWTVGLRVRNLLDRRYAERADFAFGNYRYFPGAGRSWMLSIDMHWQ